MIAPLAIPISSICSTSSYHCMRAWIPLSGLEARSGPNDGVPRLYWQVVRVGHPFWRSESPGGHGVIETSRKGPALRLGRPLNNNGSPLGETDNYCGAASVTALASSNAPFLT